MSAVRGLSLVYQLIILLMQKEEENTLLRQRLDRMSHELTNLKDYVFGQRSEKNKALNNTTDHDDSGDADEGETDDDLEFESITYERKKRKSRKNRIPKDAPRVRITYDLTEADKHCTCGCGQILKKIGEVITEQLCIIPEQIYVKQHVRFKYAGCPNESVVIIAPMLPQPIKKGLPSPEIIAHIAVNKFEDHLPLYRQEKRYQRYGIDLSRQTQCDWLREGAQLLARVVERIKDYVLAAPMINTDDTPVKVQNKGAGKTKTGRLWVYAGSGRKSYPYIFYDYTDTRSHDKTVEILSSYSGYIQADAYPGYDCLFLQAGAKASEGKSESKPKRIEVGCMMHCRRKFYKVAKQSKKRGLAYEAVQWIKKLYKIEKQAKDENLNDQERHDLRQREAEPIIKSFFEWLEDKAKQVLPKTPVYDAVQYALNHQIALRRYLDDGMLEIDNGYAERLIKPTTIGKKNYMFFGNDRGGESAAVYYTLIQSAKLYGLKSHIYMADLLMRIPAGLYRTIDDLLPHRWKPYELDTSKPIVVEDLICSYAQGPP